MNKILLENPLVLLFAVVSLGYLFGALKVKGNSLGVAAILFTGLAFGAINPNYRIPDIVFQLGLAIFVYSIGISSGAVFFKSFKQNGLRDFTFSVSMLVLSGLVAVGLWFFFDFSAATITGAYAGSTTNTPALAGVLDYITNAYSKGDADSLMQESVIGYTFSYPMGVLGGMIAIVISEKLMKIDYADELKKLRKIYPVEEKLTSAGICITNPEICNVELRDLWNKYDWNVRFGRIVQDERISLISWNTVFKKGDLVMVVGSSEDIDEVVNVLGERKKTALTHNRKKFDTRRIFVSNPMVAGRTIASLNIDQKYNAIITRIRRGDVDMLASGDTVLEIGDRIRFIARRKDLRELSKFFGDSYYATAKVNLFSFGLGIGLGLVLGSFEFQITETFKLKLGYAGGPLIVGLILGALRRTGRIVWSLPYSAGVTLQQIGLMLLLAAIGVKSGSAFIQSLSLESLWIFIASVIISLVTAFSILIIGFKLIKIPFSLLMGMVSNQPAILDFAMERSGNRIPMFGFTMIFPIALIMKIVIAQLLFVFLR